MCSMLFMEDHEHAGTVEFAMIGSSLALNLLPSSGYRQHTEVSQDVLQDQQSISQGMKQTLYRS